MDVQLLLEYGWVLVVLIGLEGLLAADNAVVLAMMVKHLPEKERKKALFYGLAGAFVFRFASLFLISFLINVWQIQAIGALYLLFISVHFLLKKYVLKAKDGGVIAAKEKAKSNFWITVLKVELADIAFAVDSILAAVALAVMLPATSLPNIGGFDGGQFLVILTGGLIGVIIMRFAAGKFVALLHRKPGLETGAYLIVGWVGVKLAVYTMAHPNLAFLPEGFSHKTEWKIIFWTVLVIIVLASWFLSKEEVAGQEVKQVKAE
ncbi:TerC family protein [Alkalihalobacterium bogoriense]|uniref:TerC family protein n=1 Tax=Alkalihalobacterium bogoriense TaxID=246272 RepID=UPI00047DB844|nr:TerC family protein [Alkalihalobacterium bogoriense]